MKERNPLHTLRVINLRLWLPLFLAIVAIIRLSMLLWVEYQNYQQHVREFVDRSAHAELLQTRRSLEDALRQRNGAGMDGILSELGLEPMIQRAALIDENGRVVTATRFAWKGLPAAGNLPGYPTQLAAQVRGQRRERLVWDAAHSHLLALAPVVMGLRPDELRSHRIGLLLVEYDLAPLQAEAWQRSLQMAGMSAAVLVLTMLLLYALAQRFILRPAQALAQGMQRIGQGQFDAIPKLRGGGEFKVLGEAMARMAEDLQRSRHALAESEARYRHLSDAATEAIFIHDGGTIVDANAAAGRLIGLPAEALKGRDIYSLVAEHDRQRKRDLTAKGMEGRWALDFLAADGSIVPAEVAVREWQSGGHSLRVVAAHDIRERLAAEEEIRQLSNFDPLTGLPNRKYLQERVVDELATTELRGQHAALAAFDLDGFTAINESLGMAAGDAVLRGVAQRLTNQLQQGQLLARLHGDTFSLLMPELEPALEQASTQAARTLEKLLGSLAQPLAMQDHTLHLSASAGVVMIPNDSRDPGELLREAETAMHQAKLASDNRIRFFAHDLQQAASRRLRLRNDLKAAVDAGGQLLLHYQPQVDARGQLRGIEALVRWQHPERGLVAPGEFIAEAEASGLIVPLGNWVLEEAVACMQRCRASCEDGVPWPDGLAMGVNVSPRQFREPDFVRRIEDLLDRLAGNPLLLELELTESVLADDLEATLEKMQVLRRHGVKLALDDFGTGYSSLSYLKRMPINTLKIDRSFVIDIDAQPHPELGKRPAALIEAIIGMAHQLDLQVLAEGVETEAQHARLLQAGCDIFQGYLFSRPLPEKAMREWMRQRAAG
ncbi:MAG: putative bifunctional diguanylate cyclase/phosphodiesterase [Thermomonas sp.]